MHRYRLIPTLLATAMAAFPIGDAWGAAPAHAAHTHAVKAKSKKYQGPSVDMRWGPVQATITVKNMKITAVSILTTPENVRSQGIDDQAVPILQQETLLAQSATINEVSGATMTSDAFMQSLHGAIKKARHAKALK